VHTNFFFRQVRTNFFFRQVRTNFFFRQACTNFFFRQVRTNFFFRQVPLPPGLDRYQYFVGLTGTTTSWARQVPLLPRLASYLLVWTSMITSWPRQVLLLSGNVQHASSLYRKKEFYWHKDARKRNTYFLPFYCLWIVFCRIEDGGKKSNYSADSSLKRHTYLA
jgi:hypothetical protein